MLFVFGVPAIALLLCAIGKVKRYNDYIED